jgi:integrase
MSGNGAKPDCMRERFLVAFAAEGRSPETLRAYRGVLKLWERSGLDPVSWLAAQEGKVALSSRCQRGWVLRRYCRWAAENGLAETDPMANVHLRRAPLQPIRPLSDGEVDRLLAACQVPRERALVLVLLETGIRIGELLRLRPVDIDLAEGTLYVLGKGQKVRQVALGLASAAALAELLTAKPARAGKPGRHDFMPSAARIFPMTHSAIYKVLQAVAVRAGVQGVHPHRFRHTFANMFLARGGDIGDLRVLLGHTNFQMTAHYARFHEAGRALAAHRRLFSPALA